MQVTMPFRIFNFDYLSTEEYKLYDIELAPNEFTAYDDYVGLFH